MCVAIEEPITKPRSCSIVLYPILYITAHKHHTNKIFSFKLIVRYIGNTGNTDNNKNEFKFKCFKNDFNDEDAIKVEKLKHEWNMFR